MKRVRRGFGDGGVARDLFEISGACIGGDGGRALVGGGTLGGIFLLILSIKWYVAKSLSL